MPSIIKGGNNMICNTIEFAVKKAVSASCKSDVVTKDELEVVLAEALTKILSDRDFTRLVREIIKDYNK